MASAPFIISSSLLHYYYSVAPGRAGWCKLYKRPVSFGEARTLGSIQYINAGCKVAAPGAVKLILGFRLIMWQDKR